MVTPGTIDSPYTFGVRRLGEIMSPNAGEPHEAWGVLNPGGVRSADGTMHLFPRLIAEGNYSRIGHARVIFEGDEPVGVERLGLAIEPQETYEVNRGGGGTEDARVVYIPLLQRYVMTYTAVIPSNSRVAIAVSDDLITWRRLGFLQYAKSKDHEHLQLTGNKDASFFPLPVRDPEGVESFAIVHRPTAHTSLRLGKNELIMPPPRGFGSVESIWISYVSVASVVDDIANLTMVRRHERLMGSEQPWEAAKLGGGAPPVQTPGGWVFTYHGVSESDGSLRYSMGIAILDLVRPTRVLYRTPSPLLEPETDYERNGLVSNVVFPSATDLRSDGDLDVYYGAADHAIAAARIALPSLLKTRA